MAVWTTIQNEQFKRKASELAYRWDVMDAADHEELRPEFRGDECINTATGNIEKYSIFKPISEAAKIRNTAPEETSKKH